VSAIAIGGIVFVCVFGGALLGVLLQSALPEHHRSTDTRDVVKLTIALVATMSALLLSLLVATAKSAYDTRSNELTQLSGDIVVLDRLLAHYGPETKEARALLRSSVAAGLERFRRADHGGPASLEPTGSFEIIYDKIEELSPQSEAQRSLQGQALNMAISLGRTRLLLFENVGSSIPFPVPVGFGFLARRHFCQLWPLCTEKWNRSRCLPADCIIGLLCDFFDPGTRSVVRRDPSGVQRPVARGTGPSW
jgi:hypothetical protein